MDALTRVEAAILAHAIDSEVHWLGWVHQYGWTEQQFHDAYAKLRAMADDLAPTAP